MGMGTLGAWGADITVGMGTLGAWGADVKVGVGTLGAQRGRCHCVYGDTGGMGGRRHCGCGDIGGMGGRCHCGCGDPSTQRTSAPIWGRRDGQSHLQDMGTRGQQWGRGLGVGMWGAAGSGTGVGTHRGLLAACMGTRLGSCAPHVPISPPALQMRSYGRRGTRLCPPTLSTSSPACCRPTPCDAWGRVRPKPHAPPPLYLHVTPHHPTAPPMSPTRRRSAGGEGSQLLCGAGLDRAATAES